MDESVIHSNPLLTTPSDYLMDLDYMDGLLLEGCWLETTDGNEFLQHSPATFNAPFDSSFMWPNTIDTNNVEFNGIPSKDAQEENLSINHCQELNYATVQSFGENVNNAMCTSSLSENHLVEAPELNRRWWFGPKSSSSVMDRLIWALGHIRDCSRDKDILLQLWVPINRDGKRVLSTTNQPFLLDLNCPRLANYREVSVNYQFPANEDSKEIVGLPGRVFADKVPEWTPDVRFFKSEEYPRVGHAQQYDVRGTLAVPVFEQGSRNCLGVIEVVMTTRKIKYRPELESVCKALEAVDLRTSEVSTIQDAKVCDLSYQAALPEVLEVLKSACETHGLPLAQTWVPCVQQGKGGCRHSEENLTHCVSTEDSACYVADPRVQGFHEACSEHHLLKGKGVVGRAFMTNQPCFSADLTSYSKSEYPLSHYAKMFGLQAAVAIRLRSISTGSSDFVLEFFLPSDCRNPEEHRKMLTSLSIIIQNVCRTLRVVTDKELQEETVSIGEIANPTVEQHKEQTENSQERTSWTSCDAEFQESSVISAFQDEKPDEMLRKDSVEFRHRNDSAYVEGVSRNPSRTGDRRRAKAEKTITLQILQQYFAGSLKDAAKSIGVCPTTLKRICRQHGIKRWPSRKIKKVGHSLQKIQRVIDSVQGASGTLQIESFYSNFPELQSPNASRLSPFADSKSNEHPTALNTQPNADASKSPSSSCSRSSSSSQCCSSGTKPQSHPLNIAGDEDPIVQEESVDNAVKRVKSEPELHLSSEALKTIPRSQSHACVAENPKSENLIKGPRISQEEAPRVKVTHGEEKIRFRMQNSWKYSDLLREITRRFGIDDPSGLQLKYLDDDSEWVLLTCDADLEECIDVCMSSQNQMIKLILVRDSQHHFGSSFGSSSPILVQ
ncbi:protein NLP4-like isoform X1 [Lycium ferocissimum]|uniref:protein NLP4-like isoform X1 n=1 Tax=Lycium ferocissimum TaxID=112874 RepID=UPI0028168BCC|nr:protein NLP4-like isoform X1 [Lycium ferocissimum]XP_059278833.1 protein NLP4-like isoform X1 [Lycium ferocissimum]XP_059278834.1 protein NLP4-like isoform X1 [Lycium ferocissimum]